MTLPFRNFQKRWKPAGYLRKISYDGLKMMATNNDSKLLINPSRNDCSDSEKVKFEKSFSISFSHSVIHSWVLFP